MYKKNPIISIFLLTTLIVVSSGCASLNSDVYLPESIKPVENDLRFQGSVNVKIFFPNVTNNKVHNSQLGEFINTTNLSHGKIDWDNDDFKGYTAGGDSLSKCMMNNDEVLILRGTLEKAIDQKGLFLQIEQGSTDYILDVFFIDFIRSPKALTVSNEMFITSIWRLTRVKDRKVVICAFVRGHGKWGGSREKAIQDMIQNGLMILSDPSMPVTAMNVAGDWPSIGAVIPEGYSKFLENWAKLHKGMTEKDVRSVISFPSVLLPDHFPQIYLKSLSGPFLPSFDPYIVMSAFSYDLNNTCAIQRLFDSTDGTEVYWKRKKPVNTPCGWITSFQELLSPNIEPHNSQLPFIVPVPKIIYEPFYPFYNLTFVKNGKWVILETAEKPDYKYKIIFQGEGNWVLESYELKK
ncbi:MAG: hypothetical protein JXL81_11640 [Deltaproteobacteria bacterium]|nr:hypothetical protein [Deltaproteobacteria bacterium]